MLFTPTQSEVIGATKVYTCASRVVSEGEVSDCCNELWELLNTGKMVGEYHAPTLVDLLRIPDNVFHNAMACIQEWAVYSSPVYIYLARIRRGEVTI